MMKLEKQQMQSIACALKHTAEGIALAAIDALVIANTRVNEEEDEGDDDAMNKVD